ncbi:probable beta-mannosidase B [Aspergillus udagawae]|uniref:Beta-mannosidase B n=1 Tax=Aspergillus udagawae TaxID=91492 RepID=A0ABQ1B6U4_9EURO|nr:probable beta-mannosidase B [Aspergillus udagawae]
MMHRTTQQLTTGWSLKQADAASEDGWLPVQTVPSQVHIDLLANEKIPDPFVDANELAVQWISEKDWIYRTKFSVPSSSDGVITDLVFLGLDTFATVTVNGTTVLQSENMHISHRVHISEHLRQDGEDNELQIVFHSARQAGDKLIKQHPEHVFHVRQTEASRIPVRKAQYNWGWDWGPILMTAGPWRPVILEQYTYRIDDVWTQYEISADNKTCSGTLYARIKAPAAQKVEADFDVILSLSYEDKVVFEHKCRPAPDGLAKTIFQLDSPALWYPHGYGTQPRYQLSAKLVRADNAELDEQVKLIGLRRCELIQVKDEFGKSFYFRINGIDVFAGGSCWIPADSYPAQISKDRYFNWMKLMVESNQIMLRVWGGGIYEDNALLDACDQLGIMVWHDFAFACANYPVYDAFLKSIEEEARQNIRRLRSHPSVVIWAGNNEDYQVQERYKLEYDFENKDPETWKQSTFPARYIYEYLMPRWVKEEDPSCIYHPSSPWGDGKPTADQTVGDIHQWDLWHGPMSRYQDCADLSGRFVSEFGMEAYPHLGTLRRVITDSKQQRPGTMMMDFRNKAGDHERRMLTYVSENFLVPSDLPTFTHVTQILQAETMRYAYKAWRRMWGQPGSRRCGGVLVWQLNDCWPTISWAVVDYYLIRKPAFYAIARALKPLDVGLSRNCPVWTSGHADPFSCTNSDEFELWIASSKQETVEVDVTVKFISIESGELVSETIHTRTLAKPNSTTEVLAKQLVKVHNASAGTFDPFVIYAVISVGGQVVATDTAWPQPLKYLDFSNRNIKEDFSPSGDEVTVSADLPVKGFVFEDREGLKLSDNGFDLMPGEKKVVTVNGTAVSAKDLRWTYVGA